MTPKKAVLNLIFGFAFYLRFQYVHLNRNAVFDDLRYYTDAISWKQAVTQCSDSIATLVPLNPDPDKNNHNVSVVKRSVHFHNGNESWVGDYSTYEVISGKGRNLNISVQQCVAMHVTQEKVLPNNSLLHEYELVTQNCTSDFFAICIGNNNTIVTIQSTTSWSDARQNCRLWIPEYNTLPVAEQNTFARGSFTTPPTNVTLFNKFFWVSLIVQETRSKLPVVGNILRCGYIGYMFPGIYYADCFQKKAFICKKDRNSSTSGSPVGLYVGISVALVIVGAACIAAVIILLRNRRSLVAEKVPHGGTSFTRRNKDTHSDKNGRDNTGFKEENRLTTYHQIDLNNMKSNSPNEISKENVDIVDNMYHPAYSSVYKKNKNGNKPDVVPRNTKTNNADLVRSGYLAMDGKGSNQNIEDVNKEYDFLESMRSSNSTSYKQMDTGGDNIYNSTTCSINESTYDVTWHQSFSVKRQIDEDYDHVMVETGSETMNRKMCDSIGEKSQSVNTQMTEPMSNPGYDYVIK